MPQAILKIPFDKKEELKLIAKQHKCALWFDFTTKYWNFSGNVFPKEFEQFLVDGSLIDDSSKTHVNQPYTYFIDYPFELREEANKFGLIYNNLYKSYSIKTHTINEDLKIYLSQPYSYEAWLENFINGKPREGILQSPKEDIWNIRKHQKEASVAAINAYKNKYSGFLIADQVGLGKTISALSSIRDLNLGKKEKTVLIVTTISAIAHWRNTFLQFNSDDLKILIINYDRLQKLFKPQEDKYKQKAKSKRAKTKRLVNQGLPPIFDICVWDESHKMKNNQSNRSKLGRKIANGAEFNLYLSATAGQNPLELSYLIPVLASVTGQKPSTMEDFEKWCKSMNLGIYRAEFGKWVWDGSEQSIKKIKNLLFNDKNPAAIRRLPQNIAGWPEINRELTCIELTPEQYPIYQQTWEEFVKLKSEEFTLKQVKGKNSTNHLVANLRFRQKASLLKLDTTIEHILDGLENNVQVAVSVAFQETLNNMVEILKKHKVDCAVIHGKLNPKEKEENRMDFQTGRKKVCIFTVEEAISLHQGEHNNTPRILLIHDLRWSAISMSQIEGRTHRDGKFCQTYWMFLKNTIEMDIAQIVLNKVINMNSMVGDDVTCLKEIEEKLNQIVLNANK